MVIGIAREPELWRVEVGVIPTPTLLFVVSIVATAVPPLVCTYTAVVALVFGFRTRLLPSAITFDVVIASIDLVNEYPEAG